MKWNTFPYHKIPIIYHHKNQSYTIGWVVTPNIDVLKDDMQKNIELVKR